MKKIILTLVFVFAMGSFTQLNADNEVLKNNNTFDFLEKKIEISGIDYFTIILDIKKLLKSEDELTVDDCFGFAIQIVQENYIGLSEDEETYELNRWYAWCWCLKNSNAACDGQ